MKALVSEITLQKQKLIAAYKNLHLQKFEQGFPFLIFSQDLPDTQSYLEYADGRIELQEMQEIGSTYKSSVIRVLNQNRGRKCGT